MEPRIRIFKIGGPKTNLYVIAFAIHRAGSPQPLRFLILSARFFPLGSAPQCMLVFFLEPGFALAQLLRKLAGDFVDGRVKIPFGVLGMNVRPWQGKMDFHGIGFFRILSLVVKKNHMRGDNFVDEFLEALDLFSDVAVDGGGEFEMTWTEVNLHDLILMASVSDANC